MNTKRRDEAKRGALFVLTTSAMKAIADRNRSCFLSPSLIADIPVDELPPVPSCPAPPVEIDPEEEAVEARAEDSIRRDEDAPKD